MSGKVVDDNDDQDSREDNVKEDTIDVKKFLFDAGEEKANTLNLKLNVNFFRLLLKCSHLRFFSQPRHC